MERSQTDQRGVSEVVSYLMGVVIVVALVTGLVVSTNSYFQNRDDRAVGSTLESEGQTLAGTIETVDRLVRRSDSDGEIGRRIDLSDSVGGHEYRISVVNASRAGNDSERCQRQCLLLTTEDVTRRVRFRSATPVRSDTAYGQRLYVVREANSSHITIREAE